MTESQPCRGESVEGLRGAGNLGWGPKPACGRAPTSAGATTTSVSAGNRAVFFKKKRMAVSLYRYVFVLAGLALVAAVALIFVHHGEGLPTTLLSDIERRKQIAQIDQWEST